MGGSLLSVVVIGRNESVNLPRLAASVERLKKVSDFPIQTIFVDSASEDDSVAVARKLFDEVFELIASPDLCASGGRHLGTLAAKYEWVLYLDGDMELCDEFIAVMPGLVKTPTTAIGFIGRYIHCFNDGTAAVQVFSNTRLDRGPAFRFGGGVMLKREPVIAVGNWERSIYGEEELYLYARLGKGRTVVEYLALPMIRHYDDAKTRWQLFKRLVYPGGGLGHVFYGFGQVIRASWMHGSFRWLVRLSPEPFIFWIVLLLLSGGLILAPSIWTVGACLAALMAALAWRTSGQVIRLFLLPLSVVTGMREHEPVFRPRINWQSLPVTRESASLRAGQDARKPRPVF